MKVTLNLYNPNFKAIELSKEEKKQISHTLDKLQDENLSGYSRNLLNSDVMDTFYPHIQKEAAKSEDPKAKAFDLNMKMFDALNTFQDKKDPLGWFLSLLNGTSYKDPEPSIFDLIEQQKAKEEEEYLAKKQMVKNEAQVPVLQQKRRCFFEIDDDLEYTAEEIGARIKELQKCFGSKYKYDDILNIVSENPYLVDYDNEYFDGYIAKFADLMEVKKDEIKKLIISRPEIIRIDLSDIDKKIEEYSEISGCEAKYCKNMILKNTNLLFLSPSIIKQRLEALSFYKKVRGKEDPKPGNAFTAVCANEYFNRSLIFLVMNNDRDLLTKRIINQRQLVEHIKSNGIKQYNFVIPEDKLSEKFVNYVESFSKKNFGKNIFDIEIIDLNKYLLIEKPKGFRKYFNKE